MTRSKFIVLSTLLAASVVGAGSAAAAGSAEGVWIDHTGRGAVEIKDCGGGLCGHVVWVKDAKHIGTCRNQVLGNVKLVSSGVWDRGWIVDPDDNSRYSVELKVLGNDKLRVMGYLGSKLFSETMIWKRAPADLKRCDTVQTASAPAQPTRQASLPASPSVSEPAVKPVEAPPAQPSTAQRRSENDPAAQKPNQQETVPQGPPTPARTADEAPPVAPVEEAKPANPEPQETTGSKKKKLDFADLIRIKPGKGGRDGKRSCRLEVLNFAVEVPCDL